MAAAVPEDGPPPFTTIITRAQLDRWGARDLLDVLRRVPGFTFGVDAQGVVGVAYRGVWAHEGRLLLLIDGVPQNELLYGTTQLGNHEPLPLVERIEITEGPAPVTVGGFGELVTINLVTRSARALGGVLAEGMAGALPHSYGERDLAFLAGGESDRAFGASAGVFLGQGTRTDGLYQDIYGDVVRLTPPHEALDPLFVQAEAHAGALRARVLFDDPRDSESDDVVRVHAPYPIGFESLAARVDDTLPLNEAVHLTPFVEYLRQTPWRVRVPSADEHLDKTATRLRAGLGLTARLPRQVALEAGLQGELDWVMLNSTLLSGVQTLEGGALSAAYQALAAFARAEASGAWGTLRAGARLDVQSVVGAFPSLELSWARRTGPVRWTLGVTSGARAPALEDFNASLRRLSPERATVEQLRVEAALAPWLSGALTVFNAQLAGPLYYVTDFASGRAGYANAGGTASRGLTAALEARPLEGLSFGAEDTVASPLGGNRVGLLAVPGRADLALGVPENTLVLQADWTVVGSLSVNAAAALHSAVWAYTHLNAAGDLELASLPAPVLLDLTVLYQDALLRGLDVSLSVFNAVNATDLLPQPYEGGHAPLPGRGRELLLHLRYHARLLP